ncbi:hypothetical protein PG985_005521 [Apiospora marii]|uniref:uncharacterized protein n=1 Tax=Apiospora marii TaxID=335849 RepID=UPI00312F6A40
MVDTHRVELHGYQQCPFCPTLSCQLLEHILTAHHPAGDEHPLENSSNDFLNEEVLDQPLTQPSVGATIVSGARGMKTAHQKADEERRRDYEESNFTRLPAESKEDRSKCNKAEGRTGNMQFGGEDWRDLGNVDRIDRANRKKPSAGSGSGGTKASLEKSRKRGREITDGNRNSGFSSNTR